MARRLPYTQPQLDLREDVGQQVRDHWGKAQGRARPIVRITRYAIQLLDEFDNLKGAAKFLIDQLRYSKLIREDRATEVEIEVTQVKVSRRVEEGTHVKIFYPAQPASGSRAGVGRVTLPVE